MTNGSSTIPRIGRNIGGSRRSARRCWNGRGQRGLKARKGEDDGFARWRICSARSKAAEDCRTPRRWRAVREAPLSGEAFGVRQPSGAFIRASSPFRCGIKSIICLESIDLETIDGFGSGGRSHTFKPAGRAPGILIRYRHQAMLHRILMNVIQPSEIGLLIGNPRVSEVEPDLAALFVVELVHPLSGFDMK